MESMLVLLGFVAGVAIGTTGMGGGTIMTPLLILSGVSPISAVGTDLIYATITKFFALLFHRNKGSVNYQILRILIPYAILGLISGWFVLNMLSQIWNYESINKLVSLAVVILLGISGILLVISSLRQCLIVRCKKCEICFRDHIEKEEIAFLAISMFFAGLAVVLTSVGSGVLVSFALLKFTRLHPRFIVGSDLAIGLFLTSFAGILHIGMGNVNIQLLTAITLPSILGSYIGTHLSHKISKETLRSTISVMIILSALTTLKTI